MNKRLLKCEMVLHGDSFTELAEYLHMSRATLSAKVNGYKGRDFTQGEISAIIDRYNLDAEKAVNIFFTKKVS